MERLETPALAVGEIVGRSANGSAGNELVGKSPAVKSSGMDSYGIVDVKFRGQRIADDSFLLLFNAHSERVEFRLPEQTFGRE